MKAGLITYYNYNYGSLLQCYATQRVIEGMGIKCVLLTAKSRKIDRWAIKGRFVMGAAPRCFRYPLRIPAFYKLWRASRRASLVDMPVDCLRAMDDFIRENIASLAVTWGGKRNIARSAEYRVFLSGSDQIWNGDAFVVNEDHFLRFAPLHKRVAWAPSFGTASVAPYNARRYHKYIREYAKLSVREEKGVDIIKNLTGREAQWVLDPVLILTGDEWRSLIPPAMAEGESDPYLFLYFINRPTNLALDAITEAQRSFGCRVLAFGNRFDEFQWISRLEYGGSSPWRYLVLIDRARMVFTDSFHAVAFSLTFHRPFWVFRRNYAHDSDQTSRIDSILDLCGLPQRFISKPRALNLEEKIDFTAVDEALARRRDISLHYLQDALGKAKTDYEPLCKPCTGCGACVNACPANAISMVPDEEGFTYPIINETLCTQCGLCEKISKELPGYRMLGEPLTACAAVNRDTGELFSGSSGGAFGALAHHVFSLGGVVAGCAFDEQMSASHVVAETAKEMQAMHGSKYVQSDTGLVMRTVKDHLERGRTVLFTGTPCQVAGLWAFLGKDYQGLITADLICHGVPSPLLFERHLKWKQRQFKDKIIDFHFRSKDRIERGVHYLIKLKTPTLTRYWASWADPYYAAFLSGDTCRESCYQCPYARMQRPGDITLGDYWQADKLPAGAVKNKGVSLVLVNTVKGATILKAVAPLLSRYDLPLSSVRALQGHLRRPTPRPHRRDTVYRQINADGYDTWANQFLRSGKYIRSKVLCSTTNFVPPTLRRRIKEVLGKLPFTQWILGHEDPKRSRQ
jgi:ferredoxin